MGGPALALCLKIELHLIALRIFLKEILSLQGGIPYI